MLNIKNTLLPPPVLSRKALTFSLQKTAYKPCRSSSLAVSLLANRTTFSMSRPSTAFASCGRANIRRLLPLAMPYTRAKGLSLAFGPKTAVRPFPISLLLLAFILRTQKQTRLRSNRPMLHVKITPSCLRTLYTKKATCNDGGPSA